MNCQAYGVYLTPKELEGHNLIVRERCLQLPSARKAAQGARFRVRLWEVRLDDRVDKPWRLFGLYRAELGKGSWLLVCSRQAERIESSNALDGKAGLNAAAGYTVLDGSLQLLVPQDPVLLLFSSIEDFFSEDTPQPWSQFVDALQHSSWLFEYLHEDVVARLLLDNGATNQRENSDGKRLPKLYYFSEKKALAFLLKKFSSVCAVLGGLGETEKLQNALQIVTHMAGSNWAERLASIVGREV